jgi:hypothetical protein
MVAGVLGTETVVVASAWVPRLTAGRSRTSVAAGQLVTVGSSALTVLSVVRCTPLDQPVGRRPG